MRMRGEFFLEKKMRLWGVLYCQQLPQQKLSPDDEWPSKYTSHLTSNLVLIDVSDDRPATSGESSAANCDYKHPLSPSPPLSHTHHTLFFDQHVILDRSRVIYGHALWNWKDWPGMRWDRRRESVDVWVQRLPPSLSPSTACMADCCG